MRSSASSFKQSLRAKALLAVTFAALSASAMSARADEAVRAVWNVQEIYLPYFGLTTHYSCDGLRDKTRAILKQLSVREDFLVTIGGCNDISGPTRNPSVHMVVANAVPATDEMAKALAADPKRAELLARMQRKNKAGSTSDEPFNAVLKRVTLRAKDRSGAAITAGDCELLEQMRREVLPKLGARIIKDEMRCTPYQGIIGNPRLEVELLVAVPEKT